MKDLKTYISNNKNQFETEPGEGHFERFKDLLDQQTKVRKISILPQLLKVAAIVVLVTFILMDL